MEIYEQQKILQNTLVLTPQHDGEKDLLIGFSREGEEMITKVLFEKPGHKPYLLITKES